MDMNIDRIVQHLLDPSTTLEASDDELLALIREVGAVVNRPVLRDELALRLLSNLNAQIRLVLTRRRDALRGPPTVELR
jgi:hypothetical protein